MIPVQDNNHTWPYFVTNFGNIRIFPKAIERLLNAKVARSKKYPFGVHTTIELKNITTSDSNDI